jgi:hypothetical protein
MPSATTGSRRPRRDRALPFLARWARRLQRRRRPADLLRLLGIGIGLISLQLALRAFGLRRVLAHLGRPLPAVLAEPKVRDAALNQAERLAIDVDAWLRRLRPRNPCLRRSLLLFGRLRRAGVPVTFCLGIRKGQVLGADGPIDGHAWLELDGQVLLESPATAEQNLRTFSYP